MARSLLEWKQNLLVRSEEFADAAWTRANASIASNVIANPLDGALTADAIVDDTATSLHYVATTNPFTAPRLGAWLAVSIYAKEAKPLTPWLLLSLTGAWIGGGAYFNLDTGATTLVLGSGFCEIQALSGGWRRCSVAGPCQAEFVPCGLNIVPTVASGVFSYTGDGTASAYVWGAQVTLTNGPVTYGASAGSQVNPAAGLGSTQPVDRRELGPLPQREANEWP